MKDVAASRKYAEAVFLIAREENKLTECRDNILLLQEALNKCPEFFTFFHVPHIPKDIKKNILKDIFKNKLLDSVLNFLMVLIDKKREDLIFTIIELFMDMYNEEENIEEVEVITSLSLSENLYKNISGLYERKLGKKIKLLRRVKPEIIGGIIVKIKDNIINTGFNYCLDDIKDKLELAR